MTSPNTPKKSRKEISHKYYEQSKTTKICPSCQKELTLISFPVAFSRPSGRASHCKDCRKSRYPYNPKSHKIAHLRNRYGLEWENYLDLYEKQKGKCKICGSRLDLKGTVNVDHCHKTGKVRGMLCSQCNRGLGNFKENTEFLKKAIEYIQN